jgi:hypothetical protein
MHSFWALFAAAAACLPGFGAVSSTSGGCRRCQRGSYAPGGSLAPCEACPDGMTSVLGAVSAAFCVCKPGEVCRPVHVQRDARLLRLRASWGQLASARRNAANASSCISSYNT